MIDKGSYSNSRFAQALGRLARAVCRGREWFVYPQIVLAAVCLFYAAHWLRMDSDRDHLIGPHVRSQQIRAAFQREFPMEGKELVVVVESEQMERNRQFVERLAAKARAETNLFTDPFYKADLSTLGPKGLLLASTNDLAELRKNLQEYLPGLEQFSGATNLESLFADVNARFRNGRSDPKGGKAVIHALPFLQTVMDQALQAMVRPGRPPPPEVQTLFAGGNRAVANIYVTPDGGRKFLLTMRPRNEAVTGQAIERLRALIRATQEEVPGTDVGLTGAPVLNYDEMHQAQHDTTKASIVALILCAAIFIVAYRQVGRPLKATLCLLIGLGYTLGFTAVAIGHLNILTITFAPMLIGLAIDFGIHYISRYEEEMRHRRSASEAVERATAFTGQGILTGALTTAAAFLAMALTHFKGIREMGLISGVGVLLCLVPMMTALPALLLRGKQNIRDHEIGPAGQRRLRIEHLWLQHPVMVLVATGILCVGAGLLIHRVHFDYDLLRMQSQSLPSVVYERKLLTAAGAASRYGTVMADSVDEAREFEAGLKPLPIVAEVRSAADFLTPDQDARLQLVESIKEDLAGVRFAPVDYGPVNADSLSATLWYLTGYLGLASEATAKNDPALAQQLRALRETITRFRVVMMRGRPESVVKLAEFQQGLFGSLRQTIGAIQTQDTRGPMQTQDLPPVLRDRFIGKTGKYLVQVYSKKDLWQHENQREFIEQLHSVIPPDRVTGTAVQVYEYTTLLRDSYVQAAGYACLAIMIMVFLHFRSLLLVLLGLVPVAVGGIWLLGFMGLAHISFNPANIMTLPLMVGIGVTNGIQVLNRFAEEQKASIFGKSTGKAVLVSGLTAIVGFGSLMLAGHEGIRSLGIVMSFGIGACMVAALMVLPALLRILVVRSSPKLSAGMELRPAHP